jgi:uncharacterized membrane protein (UPF0127 family)
MKISASTRNKIAKGLLVGFMLLVLANLGIWFAGEHQDNVTFPRSSLVILRSDGERVGFNVEVATTEEQHRHGLMFRQSMPRDDGMLFLFQPPQWVSIWMKDTPLPLDMVFVRSDGTIVKIVTHTEPYSVQTIPSDDKVQGMIEINAGEADRRGIQVGDKLIYPGFGGS